MGAPRCKGGLRYRGAFGVCVTKLVFFVSVCIQTPVVGNTAMPTESQIAASRLIAAYVDDVTGGVTGSTISNVNELENKYSQWFDLLRNDPSVSGTRCVQNASPGIRIMLDDAVVLQAEADAREAYVHVADLRGQPLVLTVHCPMHVRTKRSAYVKALGHALHLVAQAHAADRQASSEFADRQTSSEFSEAGFVVFMMPRPQLNCVIALGCLGYFVDVDKAAGAEGKRLLVRSEWPLAEEDAEADAHDFQLQTVWHPKTGVFRTSYYDLCRNQFDWVQRDGVFENYIASRKARRELHLVPLQLARMQRTHERTQVYVEYERHDGRPVSFFGAASDVVAKMTMLPEGSPGLVQLRAASVYYVDSSRRTDILDLLNSRDMPVRLDASQLEWMPAQAMRNLGKLWVPALYKSATERLQREPTFFERVMARVPKNIVHVLADTLRSVADGGVTQTLFALATCPEVMSGVPAPD